MKRKIDLFDELSIKKPEKDIYTALDTDIQSVRHAVDKKLAFAFTERELKIMKSRKKIVCDCSCYGGSFGCGGFCRKRECG